MDKHLNNIESKIQELLGSRDFNQLSPDERVLVLSQMSKEDYILQRKIHVESKFLYEELGDKTTVAAPLILPNERKSFWFKSHPFYHTGIAVAATIILMLFIKYPGQEAIKTENKTEYISKVDTVYQKEYIHDTVTEIKEKPVVIEKVVEKVKYVEVPNQSDLTGQSDVYKSKRVLTPGGSSNFPTIGINETPDSEPFTEDATLVLVQDLVLSD